MQQPVPIVSEVPIIPAVQAVPPVRSLKDKVSSTVPAVQSLRFVQAVEQLTRFKIQGSMVQRRWRGVSRFDTFDMCERALTQSSLLQQL
jgi:hypothetical protein